MEINAQNASNILGTLGSLAGALNPAIGTGMIMAGKALEKMNQMDDEMLDSEFVGLSQLSAELQLIIDSKEVDFEKLQYISNELRSLSVGINKFSKMIG